ncbi:hypothetical protein EDD11_001153 [Mortierella claussenii]|nr:hypothetical protein EDD11_001153 [Mortierella claussenii]
MPTQSGRTPHPYFPRDLVLDHYVANTNSVLHTLLHVSIAFLAIVVLTVVLGYPKQHSTLHGASKRLTFFWFTLCGLIHIFFEGYFGLFHAILAGDNSPMGQVRKEYALSVSRYLSSDPFVLMTERITIVSRSVNMDFLGDGLHRLLKDSELSPCCA